MDSYLWLLTPPNHGSLAVAVYTLPNTKADSLNLDTAIHLLLPPCSSNFSVVINFKNTPIGCQLCPGFEEYCPTGCSLNTQTLHRLYLTEEDIAGVCYLYDL